MAVIAMLAIQLSNALSMNIVEQVGPAGTTWLRMCFGAVFLVLLARGAASGGLTTFCLSAADRIPLGTAVAIEFLGPLTVAALTSKNRKALVWPVLALIGVVLLTEPWHGRIDLLGVLFALTAGICWGLYNLLTQHVGDRFSGLSGLALTIPISAVVTLPLGLTQVVTGDLAWWVLPAAAGIALITPVIAFGLEMAALRRMTHTAFGTLLSIEPAFGVLMGLLVLGQTPAVFQLVGIALVIVAGAAAQRDGARQREPAPE